MGVIIFGRNEEKNEGNVDAITTLLLLWHNLKYKQNKKIYKDFLIRQFGIIYVCNRTLFIELISIPYGHT